MRDFFFFLHFSRDILRRINHLGDLKIYKKSLNMLKTFKRVSVVIDKLCKHAIQERDEERAAPIWDQPD